MLQRFGDVHACVEASGQTLDNVNQTNPVLASGKLVLKNLSKFDKKSRDKSG